MTYDEIARPPEAGQHIEQGLSALRYAADLLQDVDGGLTNMLRLYSDEIEGMWEHPGAEDVPVQYPREDPIA